jgi:hypothetical protein
MINQARSLAGVPAQRGSDAKPAVSGSWSVGVVRRSEMMRKALAGSLRKRSGIIVGDLG